MTVANRYTTEDLANYLLWKGSERGVDMRSFIAVLLMSASLLGPVSFAEEHHRYYDRDRRDYHEWNEGENRAYRHWLMEERRERRYREYRRLRREQQREYWRWRHLHPDWR
jgi:hypothetical protein